MRTPLLPMLCLAALSIAQAQAQAQMAPSAAEAHALEQQAHDALAALADGTPIADRPVTFTPEGDHYLVRVPLAALGEVEPADAAFTAHAKRLDANRWSLDDQRLPGQFKVTSKARAAVPPGSSADAQSEPAAYAINLGQQDMHGVFDSTYATPTTSEGTITELDVLHTGGMGPRLTHLDRLATQSSLRPIDADHVDLQSDASGEGYAVEAAQADGSTFKMTIATLHVVTSLSGVAHDKLWPLLRMSLQTARLKPTHDDPAAQTAIAAGLRQMLVAARDVLTGGRVEETASDLRFDVGGHAGSMARIDLAISGDAPQAMLNAAVSFSVDGLVLDDLPPAMAAYVPTHVSIRPMVANLSVADLTRMALDALAPGAQRVPLADTQALFSHGGIAIGFDTLALDVAGAELTGSGQFTLTGPQTINGAAELSAQGLDGLIAKAQTDPLLARGAPAIIFLKGIAHTVGDRSVWQVSVAGGKVLVNGVDLSAMAGAMH